MAIVAARMRKAISLAPAMVAHISKNTKGTTYNNASHDERNWTSVNRIPSLLLPLVP